MRIGDIYIAGFFDTRLRLLLERSTLEAKGFRVRSRWLDEPPVPESLLRASAWPAYALRDLKDIKDTDSFVLDTIDETPRGGREVELGFAMAEGKNLFRIGPARNVFHTLIPFAFSTWAEFYVFLEALQ